MAMFRNGIVQVGQSTSYRGNLQQLWPFLWRERQHGAVVGNALRVFEPTKPTASKLDFFFLALWGENRLIVVMSARLPESQLAVPKSKLR